ncbi:sensor histidine kinase [Streptantibioticus rubrisoli]|uniref:Sensor histidine kinase n=1 Tax=Streptantibioticus rubrisoli TaxID=1387313 RepID=A0ABT1PID1_9ACTN|nr:sensor histidine kinase [Streptantibioticus rubrisoli]MCQ4043993.1 sensor histidine kinase [Streptantibioticus rubrisoli]
MTVDERTDAGRSRDSHLAMMGRAPENRLQQWSKLCWALVYLLYLGSAVGDLTSGRHSAVAVALGWAGLVLFVGWYLYLLLNRRPRRDTPAWWQLAIVCGLYALALALSLTLGSPWLVMFTYVTVSVGVLLPIRHVLWAVPFCAVTILAVGALLGARQWDVYGLFFPALLGGAAMMGVGQMGRMVRELREARETVARLAAAEERLRLARDLHDLLGHSLSLITLKSELAGRMLPEKPQDAARQVADIEKVSRQALVDVREAVSGYRRPTVGVELAGARTALRTAGVEAEVSPTLDLPLEQQYPGLGAEEQGALAWALREAVTNVIRHSGAKHCSLTLDEVWEADEGRYLRLEVADDGRGPGRSHHPGNGLGGLEERLMVSGGRLRTGTSKRGGFSLSAYVPLRTVRQARHQTRGTTGYPQA